MSFKIPFVASHGEWGPPPLSQSDKNSNVTVFQSLPYAPFGRSDRLGRAADFTSRHFDEDQINDNNEDGDTFQLVDTTKLMTKRFVNPATKRRQHSQRLRQINARRQQSSGGHGAATRLEMQSRGGYGGGRGYGRGRGSGGGRSYGGGRGYGGGSRYGNSRAADRPPSVAVQSEWKKCDDLDLNKITKSLQAAAASSSSSSSSTAPPASVKDLVWAGVLDPYHEPYDKITTRQTVPLRRAECDFYQVTTTDDPVLEKLAIDSSQPNEVYVTDAILAHLMTSPRSVYPWDIVVTKLPNGTLFWDKRDNSSFDYLTVHETSHQPPSDETGNNSPERLGLEATMVNQNFSQQILKRNTAGRQNMRLPNPFYDEDDPDNVEPASMAYRYRQFTLESGVKVVVRTELHGLHKSKYMTAFGLNEYVGGSSGGGGYSSGNPINWRDKMDNQRGAVLANELKNNSFKLAKWTAQSFLAGADQMKIGFVTRANAKNPTEHVILGTQGYRVKDFATQITLNESNMWSVFGVYLGMLAKQPAGKYVLVRDAAKPIVTLYSVPMETFEEDEESDDDEA